MADEEAENLENWEEQADSGMLDKRLEEMALELQNKDERKKQVQKPHSAADGIILSEDSGRSQYQPQVRILRREAKGPGSSPQNHINSSGATSISKSSKHSKSLQQREAEYAQARLRIFGSLPPDDDEDDDSDDVTSDEAHKVCDNNIQSQSSPEIIKPDPSCPHMTVLRQPKGPDGTNGFTKAYPT